MEVDVSLWISGTKYYLDVVLHLFLSSGSRIYKSGLSCLSENYKSEMFITLLTRAWLEETSSRDFRTAIKAVSLSAIF